MFGLKMGELLIIFLVILVLFGGTKLPQLGSSLGQAIRNFKKGFGGLAERRAELGKLRAPEEHQNDQEDDEQLTHLETEHRPTLS